MTKARETFGWVLPGNGSADRLTVFRFKSDADGAARAQGRSPSDVVAVMVGVTLPGVHHRIVPPLWRNGPGGAH